MRFRRPFSWGLASGFAAAASALFVVAACSSTGGEQATGADAAVDGGPSPNGEDATAGDAGRDVVTPLCNVGRRRCVGLNLEVCETRGWVLLQPCTPQESCDVAVGICRFIDAGPPDASPPDAAADANDSGT
jgi:hypothetical protein